MPPTSEGFSAVTAESYDALTRFLMKFPKLLLVVALWSAAHYAASEESFQEVLQRASINHPSLYSFADLYRLAVLGPTSGLPLAPVNDAPLRTAVVQPPAQFSITDRTEPQLGLLLLSGLALAAWVARRRLGYAF
jgi:hypothetical protein